jgi:phage terminase small subunit
LYLLYFDATEAYREAGGKGKNPQQLGYRLVHNPSVQAYLREKMDKQAISTGIKADEILTELHGIAFLDPVDLFTEDGHLKQLSDMPEVARKAITGIDVAKLMDSGTHVGYVQKIKLASKISALELLGKYLKMWVEVHRHEHQVDVRMLLREAGQRARTLKAVS